MSSGIELAQERRIPARELVGHHLSLWRRMASVVIGSILKLEVESTTC